MIARFFQWLRRLQHLRVDRVIVIMTVAVLVGCAFTEVVLRFTLGLLGLCFLLFSYLTLDRLRLGDKAFTPFGKAGFPGSVSACVSLGLAALCLGGWLIYRAIFQW